MEKGLSPLLLMLLAAVEREAVCDESDRKRREDLIHRWLVVVASRCMVAVEVCC
jgi:hypothetical protein